MKQLRVIIAGGGTGGHIFPAVAIAHALLRKMPDTQLLFAGAKGRMEMEKVPQEGFAIEGLDIAGFDRSNLLKNIMLPWKLLKSRWQARRIIRRFKPDVVVGVGGFASFPVMHAAQEMGIPTLLQEQNSFAGKSNTILGKKAKAICVAYKNMERFFPERQILFTGNPVRRIIIEMSRQGIEGKAKFGLAPGIKTILVTGGSQGARSVNEAVSAGLDELMKEPVQLLWQTGKHFYEQAMHEAADYGDRVKVYDFIREMDEAYAAADLVVARAGALAIAELCIAGKPVIFVPYPHAAEDHQTSNAKALESAGAAWVVSDSEVKTALVSKLKMLMADEPLQKKMSTILKLMAIKNADERIADKIIEIAEKK